ncbi:hypothetical protein QBC36DRAFT_359227 [Triangularia setosa]|uniref:Uncharacterized protein n=1 Tax=Triangularia setosa TaxID=2587417 RepID=A0AAN6W1L3_9PEZI|nr:hypothetical protein QBC36DRAFT_359227 [Podospora setosa]
MAHQFSIGYLLPYKVSIGENITVCSGQANKIWIANRSKNESSLSEFELFETFWKLGCFSNLKLAMWRDGGELIGLKQGGYIDWKGLPRSQKGLWKSHNSYTIIPGAFRLNQNSEELAQSNPEPSPSLESADCNVLRLYRLIATMSGQKHDALWHTNLSIYWVIQDNVYIVLGVLLSLIRNGRGAVSGDKSYTPIITLISLIQEPYSLKMVNKDAQNCRFLPKPAEALNKKMETEHHLLLFPYSGASHRPPSNTEQLKQLRGPFFFGEGLVNTPYSEEA